MTDPAELETVSLVIPVKPGSGAKSRLGGDAAHRRVLAEAIALDTVTAARESSRVGEIVVVGHLAAEVPGVRVVADPGRGLAAAITSGLDALRASAVTAVLLGDLPALRAVELDEALAAAREHPRAFVADVEGEGTTLIVARGAAHEAHFGPGSAALHRAAGYVELAVPRGSGLRRDVDTVEQLRAAASLGLGERTRAVLATASAPDRQG